MQPFVHAQASSRISGQDWQDDLPIHEFMDMAKHACPDLRHRLVLHNSDLGPQLAAMAFPDREDAREVALFHVRQDLGWTPPLGAWLQRCDPARLPRSKPNPEPTTQIVQSAAAHFGLKEVQTVQQVWDLLMLPVRYAPKDQGLAEALLMSSLGPILARYIFGPPRSFSRLDGGTVVVDFSWLAEGMIVAHVGAIHSLERVMACFDGQEPQRVM
jgi:hypothetical protein